MTGSKITRILSVLLLLGVFLIGMAVPASAVSFTVLDAEDTQGINSWIHNFGSKQIVENFEDETVGWHQELNTEVGTFTITEQTLPGTGESSYSDSNEARFEIQNDYNYGRENMVPGAGEQYLDSADISYLLLDLTDNKYTNLFFYIVDPSDQGAITTTGVEGESGNSYTHIFENNPNNKSWFVGIEADEGEGYLSQISWDTGSNTIDGYGLDGFGTAVPEPAMLLLFGTGLAGFTGLARRRRTARK